MPQARMIRQSGTLSDSQIQIALALASMIALAIALVYLFPDKSGAESWQPDTVNMPGP